MKSPLYLVSLVLLGAGCDVGNGELAGMGGAAPVTGSGGIATGAGGVTGRGGGIATGSGGDGSSNVCGRHFPVLQLRPEILIVLDTSASMNDGSMVRARVVAARTRNGRRHRPTSSPSSPKRPPSIGGCSC